MHIFWFQIDLYIKGDWCLCLCHELSSFCLISSVGSVMIYFQFVVYSPRGLSVSHDLSSFFLISSVCLSFTINLHFFYLSSPCLSVTIFFTFPNILWRVFLHTRFTVTEQFKELDKDKLCPPKKYPPKLYPQTKSNASWARSKTLRTAKNKRAQTVFWPNTPV